MSDELYGVNKQIKVDFQVSTGAISASMDVFDETDTLDIIQSGAMTQIGASRTYKKTFIPDEIGNWRVECTDSNGIKKIETYSVGVKNIQDIATEMAKDTTVAKESSLDSIKKSVEAMIG